MTRFVAFVCAAALVAGCSGRQVSHDEETPDAEASLLTDQSEYSLAPVSSGAETTIVATFRAPEDTTVYILNCNGAISWGLQTLVENQWVDVWDAETDACLSSPIVVQGGQIYRDTLTLVSRNDVPAGNVQSKVEPGSYRVVWHNVLTSFDPNARPFGEELALERRVSAPIAIHESR